jgi:tetratricopeptide (TPR) repeat protein
MRKYILISLLAISIMGGLILSCFGIPQIQAMLHYQRGDYLFSRGLFEDALKEYQIAIQNNSADSIIHAASAQVYLIQGDYGLSLDECNKSTEISPNYYAYMLMGQLYLLQGQTDLALDYCNKSINLNNYYAPAYALRARIYYDLRQYENLLHDCQTAIKLDPLEPQAYFVRGILELKAGQVDSRELDNAVSDFSKSLEIQPDDPIVLYNRALSYYQRGDLSLSYKDVEKVLFITHDPDLKTKAELLWRELNKKQ